MIKFYQNTFKFNIKNKPNLLCSNFKINNFIIPKQYNIYIKYCNTLFKIITKKYARNRIQISIALFVKLKFITLVIASDIWEQYEYNVQNRLLIYTKQLFYNISIL